MNLDHRGVAKVLMEMFTLVSVLSLLFCISFATDHDEVVKWQPGKCDVCKYLVEELKARLDETGKSKEKIAIGQGIDPDKKRKIDYHKSELRLIEALHDPHVCDRLLDYDLHKERKGSLRFARGKSETMKTLQGLVNRGVKVDMDIPYELWNETSAEVREMHRMCFTMVNDYEEDIEEWYFDHQDADLMDYLCEKRVLKKAKVDSKCLYEKMEDAEKDGAAKDIKDAEEDSDKEEL